MQATGEIPYDEPFMMSGFLRPDAKHIFDSEFNLLGPARSQINAHCKLRGLERAEVAHMSISELLVRNREGEFLAFCSFPINRTKLYGRAALGLKLPSAGPLREVQFSEQELGQFCTAMAIYDLLDQLELSFRGEIHIIRTREEIVEEVRALSSRGYSFLLSFGTDPELQI